MSTRACVCCLCSHARLQAGAGSYEDVAAVTALRRALEKKHVRAERFFDSELMRVGSLPFLEEVLEVPFEICNHNPDTV